MIEIERKFLVLPGRWPKGQRKIPIKQGYMVNRKGMVLRVRQKSDLFYLSVKARLDQLTSYDFEYEIPSSDAHTMFENMCTGVVEKTRHEVDHDGLIWEIDEFHGANEGLVVAEIELPSCEFEFSRPAWVSTEVTDDQRYRNASLSEQPYCEWRS